MICAFRWMAPRADLPDSVPVHHVCLRQHQHASYYHGCACGVTLLDEPDPEPDDR